jgi:ferredoxin-NADP reductase
MEEHTVKILNIQQVTYDVKAFQVEKPEGYAFNSGQATEVSINMPSFINEKRPFTFTSINSDPYLEFTIKIYSQHKGITDEMGKLKPGDSLVIRDVWGDIAFKGKGLFIAGGAGITPFISIFRDLNSRNETTGNKLVFANKKRSDIIRESEFKKILGKSFINILSEEEAEGYYHGMISETFLKSNINDFDQKFYLCGPPPMMLSVMKQLSSLGISQNSIIMDEI